MNCSKRYFKRKLKKQIREYKERVLDHSVRNSEETVENSGKIVVPQACLEEEEVSQENVLKKGPGLQHFSLKQKLKKWFIKTKPSRSCAEELFAILSEEGLVVPLSVEGLLGRKTKIAIRRVSPGSFYYLGIENQLKRIEEILQNYSKVELEINVDGIPLFKSSRMQLWPILIKVVNIKETNLELGRIERLQLKDIQYKFICLPFVNHFVLLPLLHSCVS